MGSVVDAISDAFNGIIAVASVAVATVLVTFTGGLILLSEDFANFTLDQLGIIMSWFGIDDQDIIETFVSDQRLMPDRDTSNLLTQLALQHELTQRDIIDLFAQGTADIRGSFQNYYNYGDTTYTHGLPTTDIHTEYIPDDLNTYIDAEYGITCVVTDAAIKVPTKDEYLTHILHRDYDYYPSPNTLVYLGETCPVTLTEYDFINDDYDVHITRGTHKVTETTITITPYVEAYAAYSGATQYVVGDHVMYDPGTGSVAYKCILDSLGNLPTDGTYWLEVDYDNKHTYTTEVISYDTGGVISTVVLEDSNVLIPAGSETNSFVSDTPGIAGTADFIINVVAFPAVRHYVVTYYDSTLTSADWVTWTYQIGLGTYPDIDSTTTSVTNLEMLPIIELRRGTVNIDVDTESVAYKQADRILDIIGVDVDTLLDSIKENPDIANIEDAYVYFGLDIKDDSPLVGKMLYDLFEFMYYDTGLAQDGGGYKTIMTEGAFNAALVWQSQTRTVTAGSIGPIGTNQVTAGVDVIVSRQVTADQYVTFSMNKMASFTLIDRGGLWGATIRNCGDANDTIIIPLSHYFVSGLTPLEQMDVFTRSMRLSIYSAQVTHLEWYETPEFLDLISIVIVVVGVVLAVLSSPLGGSPGVTWTSWALGMLYAVGAGMAFKMLMEQTNNPWLKAALVVMAAYAMSEYGGADLSDIAFFTADQISLAVTDYVELAMEELAIAAAAFGTKLEDAYEELDEAREKYEGFISTGFVTDLVTSDVEEAYIKGPDLNIYKAIEMQYDFDLFTASNIKAQMCDYDKYFKLGVL